MERNQIRHRCPMCRKIYTGCGYDAIPVWPGRCCDKCYRDFVIPMRIALIEKDDK